MIALAVLSRLAMRKAGIGERTDAGIARFFIP